MTPQAIQLQELIKDPENVISRYNLIYTHEEDLLISRKNRGKGFSYHLDGELIKNTNELKRIKNLVIPPMWKDVKISNFENSHLQAIGLDNKNRETIHL